jgi:hypothetical protein
MATTYRLVNEATQYALWNNNCENFAFECACIDVIPNFPQGQALIGTAALTAGLYCYLKK